MNTVKKSLISVILVLIIPLSMAAQSFAATTGTLPQTYKSKTMISIQNVKYVKDVYSNWKRLTVPWTAHRNGETALFQEQREKTVTSSLNVSVPVSSLSASLGFTVKNSVSTTIRGGNSAQLKKNESAACYYREHWKQYTVSEKVIVTTWAGAAAPVTTVKYQCETIKIAQPLDSADYGWFYATSVKALGTTLNSHYCDDNYSCKVK